jgi:1-acyl-sn-glycerol-3-phosphate acyltransferase
MGGSGEGGHVGEANAPCKLADDNRLYRFLRVTLGPAIRALWLKRVQGLEHVPLRGGAILASNHESYLDFLVVPVSGCRLPRYLVGEVFFEMPIIAWAFRTMGFIPINRRKAFNGNAFKQILRHLRNGELVGVYPEGTRSPDGKLQPAQEGIAFLAHHSEMPVVPVAVVGTHEAWPKGGSPRAHCVEVRFGEPLKFSRAAYREDKRVLASTTRQIMQRIAILAGEDYPW